MTFGEWYKINKGLISIIGMKVYIYDIPAKFFTEQSMV